MSVAELKRLVRHRRGPCVSLFEPLPGTARAPRAKLARHISELVSEAALHVLESLDTGGTAARRRSSRRPIGSRSEPCSSRARAASPCSARPASSGCSSCRSWFLESLRVGSTFSVRPVLPYLRDGRRFHLLVLAHRVARFVVGGMGEADVIDLTRAIPPAAGSSRRAWSAFVIGVERNLAQALHGESAPLVLASSEPLTHVRNAVRHCVSVSPSLFHALVASTPRRFLKLANRVVAATMAEHATLAERELEQARQERRLSSDLEEIAACARQGIVHLLFLAHGRRCAGSLAALGGEGAGGDDQTGDVLSDLAGQVLLNGGSVFELEPTRLQSPTGALAALR
ncbi:MAG: hypothetical protein U1E76_22380 [Planctomycetota bacterium]